jgi:thermolysin
VHPVNREDIDRYQDDIVDLFYLNAAYFGRGVMVYGEGLPPDLTDDVGQHWNYVAGGLDVVAHELTHGVTEFTSQLSYRVESGALNEAFSDIMGTSAEFFFQPPGSGPLMADYLIGEDVITPGGIRSLEDPERFGNPDHYSKLYVGPRDGGGVHINSTIPSHAFYLAIEGGTNRTSGIAVRGVGGSQRDQIEKVLYRAFAFLMPPSADFATARAATLQSARDLFGAGSPAEAAVAQAWTAVGVR